MLILYVVWIVCKYSLSSWDLNRVNLNKLSRVWQGKGVVEDEVSVGVLETIQVPVCVTRKHDRRSLGKSQRAHPDVPLVRSDSVGSKSQDFTREALGAILVSKGKSDGVSSVSNDGPVTPIPSLRTTMEGVVVVVLVGEDVVLLAVDGEAGVLDAVGIAS